MPEYFQHDADGNITALLSCPDEDPGILPVDDNMVRAPRGIEQEHVNKYHVDTKAKVAFFRKKSPFKINKTRVKADLVDEITVLHLPPGAKVYVDGYGEFTVNDGVAHIAFSITGEFQLEIRATTYHDLTVTIDAY